MKLLIIISIISVLFAFKSFSQEVVINEVVSSNATGLTDEDGDFEDWIEIYNTTSSNINLSGYCLTDDSLNLKKWQFPDFILSPNEFKVVFASGKDRSSHLNHWETAVFQENLWNYFVGESQPPDNWKSLDFDDSSWLSDSGSFGYGDNDDSVIINSTTTLYLRTYFTIADTSKIKKAILSVDYDDGFVAYLNGTEIARSNISAYPPTYNTITDNSHEAVMYQGGIPENFVIQDELISSLLINGVNVFAIEVHNSDASSSDLSIFSYLSFGIIDNSQQFFSIPTWFSPNLISNLHTNFKIDFSGETIMLSNPENQIVSKLTINYLEADQSLCHIPDGSDGWCISTTPSPENSNNSSVCWWDFLPEPEFSLEAGIYAENQILKLTTWMINASIRYTINGDIPTTNSTLYTSPIHIDSTLTIRARLFASGNFLPGKTITKTFVINQPTNLPIISITTDSLNLWDFNNGIYVLGPNASPDFPYFGANFWQDWEKPAHVEYFSKNGNLLFETEAALSIHGGWSRALDQRSLRIETKSYFSEEDIHYQLFTGKPVFTYKSFNLRNAGNDWFNCWMRDELMERNVAGSNVDYCEYQPCVTYLNGKYWGFYNMRERSDEEFTASNHGANSEKVDIIRWDGDVLNGDNINYLEMFNFITTNDITIEENYNQVKKYFDIENYVDYFIIETYYVNNDWIGDWTNNIKLWRPKTSNGKWRYILWDLDFGLGLGSSYTDNKLSNFLNPPVWNNHTAMFSSILQNNEFKHFFINRYADMINTYFVPKHLFNLVDAMIDSIDDEMPKAAQRWLNADFTDSWNDNIAHMVDFIRNRPKYARDYVQNYFELQDQVLVYLDVEPKEAGKIKISTIIPDEFPWLGTYFHGNAVQISAIPNPGFQFNSWESLDLQEANGTNQYLYLDIPNNCHIIAHFSGNQAANKVVISEINYNSNSSHDTDDWIELLNCGNFAIDISDWYIMDKNFYNKFVIPTGTKLLPNQRFVFASSPDKVMNFNPFVVCLGPLNFNFSNDGDEIRLFDNSNKLVCSVTFEDKIPWYNVTDGFGRTLELKDDAENFNSPESWFAGCIGGSPGTAYNQCNESIIISEINYKSADFINAGDWFEIFNHSANIIYLNNWTFTDNEKENTFTFPEGTMINPNEYLVVCQNKQLFSTHYPTVQNVVGNFEFGLSNEGEIILIKNAQGKIVQSLYFQAQNPWNENADGTGRTLEIYDYNSNINDANNWFAGCFGGSPGTAFIPCNNNVANPLINNAITLFPNPSAEYTIISSSENIIRIEVFDSKGISIKTYNEIINTDFKLNTTSFSKGIYLIKTVTQNHSFYNSLIVN